MDVINLLNMAYTFSLRGLFVWLTLLIVVVVKYSNDKCHNFVESSITCKSYSWLATR